MLKVEDYKGKKYVVHCKTKLEWDYITKVFNRVWNNNTSWNTYKSNSYIYCNQNTYGDTGNPGYNKYYELIQASDFMKEKTIDYEIY